MYLYTRTLPSASSPELIEIDSRSSLPSAISRLARSDPARSTNENFPATRARVRVRTRARVHVRERPIAAACVWVRPCAHVRLLVRACVCLCVCARMRVCL
jgi:hypothetical protein